MIGWIIGIVVVLLIVCWVIGTYNGLIKGRIVVDEAFATMDVYLKKRYDLIHFLSDPFPLFSGNPLHIRSDLK